MIEGIVDLPTPRRQRVHKPVIAAVNGVGRRLLARPGHRGRHPDRVREGVLRRSARLDRLRLVARDGEHGAPRAGRRLPAHGAARQPRAHERAARLRGRPGHRGRAARPADGARARAGGDDLPERAAGGVGHEDGRSCRGSACRSRRRRRSPPATSRWSSSRRTITRGRARSSRSGSRCGRDASGAGSPAHSMRGSRKGAKPTDMSGNPMISSAASKSPLR